MTYIPDTRNPIEKRPFSDKKEPNPYYEGLLNDEDKREMDCYDFGVQDCANAFDNIDVAFDLALDILADEIPDEQESYFTEDEEEFLMSDKVTRFIKIAMLAYAEGQRDEMVVAKIENGDEEYHDKKFLELAKDYKELSEEEFLKKYPYREYDEYGNYEDDNQD